MERQQRFSIRKFKTAVGSALLATFLLGMPVLQAVNVLAETQAQELTVQQDLNNATNLIDAQQLKSDLAKEFEAKAGTSTGELLHDVPSQELDEAAQKAQAAGVIVSHGETVKYDSLDTALADYAGQLENLVIVIEKQAAATKAYQEAVTSYKLYREALTKYEVDKSLHDAYLVAKADYDKAFEAYQSAFQAYEQELAKNVKLLADYELAKAEYTKAYSLYQDKLAKYTDTTKANEAKKVAYETALEQYNKDNAAYEKALAAHKTAMETDAAKNAQYEKDLEQYNEAYEQYKKDLAAYEEAKKAAEATVSSDAAEIEKRNAAKKADYEKALEAYKTQKAQFEEELARMKANVNTDGYLREALLQGLKFEDEAEAEISVAGARFGTANLDVYRNGQQTANVQKIWYDIDDVPETDKKVYGTDMSKIRGTYEYYVADLKKTYDLFNGGDGGVGTRTWLNYIRGTADWNNSSSYQLVPSDSAYSTTPVMLTAQGGDASIKQGVLSILKPNESATATYTNLTNSSYLGEPIDKVTVKVTNKGSATGSAFFAKNPSGGVSTNAPSGLSDFNIELQFYRKDGSLVEATKDYPMIIGLSSLSRYDELGWSDEDRYIREGYTREGITNISFRPVFYNGSGIVVANNLEDLASHLGMRYDGNNLFSDGKSLGKDTLPTPFYFYGESYINMGIIPDDFNDPDFYKIGFVGVQESGNKISFNMTRDGRWNYGYWMSLTTKVPNKALAFHPVEPKEPTYETPKKAEEPAPPVEPTKPVPPKPTVTGNEPQKPTPPVEPTYEKTEKPTPPVEPTKPLITEPQKPTEPTPPGIVPPPPGEPTPVPIPKEPEALSVTVHKATYAVAPKPTKGVTNEAGEDVSNGLIPKGSVVKFPISLPSLKAGRKPTENHVIHDYVDEGVEMNLEAIKAAYPGYDVTFSEEDRLLTLTATEAYVAEMNKDLSKDFDFVTPDLVGRVLNDGATYTNTIRWVWNDYDSFSDTVKVSTPGKTPDPDHPTNNLIEPTKTVTNLEGQNIDGQAILATDQLVYPNLWDLDQFATIKNGDKAKQIHIYIEDIDGTKATPDLENLTFIDKAKETVKTPLKATYVEGLDKADQALKDLIVAAGLDDDIQGDFVAIVPEDMAAFEELHVKTGNSISFDLKMTPKEGATGEIKNTSYQIAYGNGYKTKTTTNTIQVTTEWEDKTTKEPLKDMVTGDKTEERGDFPRYRFVETVNTKTGIKHIFERLYTTEWEENGTGRVLKDKVTDIDTKEKGDIPGMTFVKTVETETGIKHIFERLYTTEWEEEGTGRVLKDKVTDIKTKDRGDIPDMVFVKTVETETGIKHIFKKAPETPKETKTPPAKTPGNPSKGSLPSTGDSTSLLAYLGMGLLSILVAWKLGLGKKIKTIFSR